MRHSSVPNSRLAAFQVFSSNQPGTKTNAYQRRRKHVKTNFGCIACRQKRVKCDESKPDCARCCRNHRSCVYERSRPGEASLGRVTAFSAVTVWSSPTSDPKNGTPTLHLIRHLQRNWTEVLQFPQTEQIMDLFTSSTAVKTTMLALSASHLRHRSPGVMAHCVAEHFQQALALREYQALLNTPLEELGQSGIHALLVNAAFLNMLATTLPQCELNSSGEPDLYASWVFCTDTERLGWMAVQGGIRPLLQSKLVHLADTIESLRALFLGSKYEDWANRRSAHTLAAVPQTWIDFFELQDTEDNGSCSPTVSKAGDAFRPLVMLLAEVVQGGQAAGNLLMHFAFMAKLGPEFRNLLLERDERALWLFGYWLGLISRCEQRWWLDQRLQRDYEAICTWLSQARVIHRPGAEGVNVA